jgi:hypothetical protein
MILRLEATAQKCLKSSPAPSVAGAEASKRKLGDDDTAQPHTSKPAQRANTGTAQVNYAAGSIEYKLWVLPEGI